MKNFLSYFVIWRQFLTGGVSFEMLLNYMIYPQHYICKRSIASTLKKLRTAVIGGSWLLLFSNPFWKFFRPW